MSAQLIDASTDKHLWAETYALRAKLTPDIVERIRRHPTDDVAAYDHFLRGREAFRQADGERTIVELEKAVELDPKFAAAFGALAGSYILSMYWHGASSTEVLPKAAEATRRAIELDDEHALSWMARGLVAYHFEHDFVGAIRAFDRAVEIDPHHVYNRAWIGFALVMKGDEDDRAESERILREAIARDPSHHEAQAFLGWALLGWGRFAEAAEQFSICHRIVPSPFYPVLRAMVLREIDPDFDLDLALADVRGPLEEAENHAALAVIATIEGDIDGALDALDEGVARRSPIIRWFRSIAALSAPLEGHPRFAALNQRIFGTDA